MNIGELLVKPSWRRRQPPKTARKKNAGILMDTAMGFDAGTFYEYTQSDFLNELNPSSHLINSVSYRSQRIKYKYDTATKENIIDGYEEVERISIAVQEGILRHKVTHTFGNEMWFGSEGSDENNEKLVSLHRSHWNMTGMTDALNAWGRALFGTGDTAIYLYRDEERISYKVFSFENGDVFTTRKNKEGKEIFVRMFMIGGERAVEIYGTENVELWIQDNDTAPDKEKSDDGYTLQDRTSHGFPGCPVIYSRRNDVVWGIGQSTTEHVEKLLSDLAENNKYYAYQILFLTGGVVSLPGTSMGKVIASKTKDGDAKILSPANASDTFTLDITKNLDLLWECTGTVVIEPKELKAGENTGAFIRNLYWREVQWSTNELAQLRPALNKIISVFSTYVGMIEGKTSDFSKLKMSYILEPYVPKNITEEITNICMAKNSGITSMQTAAGEIPFNNPLEYQRILKETADKAAIEEKKTKAAADAAATSAEILAKKQQNVEPIIDNKAKQ